MLQYSLIHTCRRPLARLMAVRQISMKSSPSIQLDQPRETHVGTQNNADAHPGTLEAIDPNTLAANSLLKKDVFHLAEQFPHPKATKEQLDRVCPAHHTPENLADRIARGILFMMRKSFDIVTRYKHPPKGEEANPKYAMTAHAWLQRFVFLESIAGVPGMVGGMIRHLHSLRLLKRDGAWIETLLEEAYNERMHLLTFIKLTDPGYLMRGMLLISQGIFFNAFFITYLLFPRVCHRFVGYLEEEAVVTYTRCIDDMERGLLPEFASTPAPDLAIKYWNMKPGATVKDLIYYVRADESKHREVNHTLANLKQSGDPNPYALDYKSLPKETPRPTHDLTFSHTHPVGWKRDEIEI